MNIDFVPYGGWYWYLSWNFGEDSRAAWRNPGDGFFTGCTEWWFMQDCTDAWYGDLAFTLTGFEA